jgi:DNA modification methylase
MKILCKYDELLPLHKIIPNPKNPNEHSTDSTDFLAKNIDYQGIRWPIIISNRSGFIAAGHGRLYAAQQLKYASFPVVYQDFETEAQEYEFLVADNKLAEFSSTNEDLVLKALKDLPEIKIDMLAMPGLEDSIEDDQVKEGQTEDDAVPEVEDNPYGVKRGDIWELGEHRVMCGDSTSKDDFDKLLDNEKVDITFTSPPYNIGKSLRGNMYINDNDDKSNYVEFLRNWTTLCLKISKYVFHNNQFLENNKLDLIEYQNEFRKNINDILIWNKQQWPPHINKGTFGTKWEYIFIMSKNGKGRSIQCDWQGKYPNVIDTNNNSSNKFKKLHKAGFPVELPVWVIEKIDFCNSVFDPFMGTGSTLIACEKTNRKCYGMEIDEHYVSVIIKRWEDFTGLKARRITTAN